jgi:aspartate/tyrosine/aromatic aminotransferase
MFSTLPQAPPDAILGLGEAFKLDPNPRKINLSVGVYKKSQRAVTAQTPGGTGSLRVAADFLAKHFPQAKVWVSTPTWANHAAIFKAAGQAVETYPYIDKAGRRLDFPAMLAALAQIPAGDIVVLHACCHNPTGIDPTPAQWRQIAAIIRERGLLPLVDFAYQGFGDGLAEDAAGLVSLAQPGQEVLVCSSFSKNFGLYGERVGALTVVAADAAAAQRALSQVRVTIRTNYSNPPTHGAAIVAEVLGDAALKRQWELELAAMRDRIHQMRKLFVATMKQKAPQHDFSFLEGQKGMFSFSGLTNMQVDELRGGHAVYVVGNGGRINVAGMTRENMEPLCTAIAAVL